MPGRNEKPEGRSPDKIYAPWDVATVTALNVYQQHGQFHPFTCPANHLRETLLVAQEQGWRCSRGYCGYIQDWAWAFMAEPGEL